METEREMSFSAAKEQLRDAYARLTVTMDGLPRGVLVMLYDYGHTCGDCGDPWDGYWADERSYVCRECIDRIMRERPGR